MLYGSSINLKVCGFFISFIDLVIVKFFFFVVNVIYNDIKLDLVNGLLGLNMDGRSFE